MTIDTELIDAYSLAVVIASSPRNEVHNLWAFYLHMTLLHQALPIAEKFPTAAFHGS